MKITFTTRALATAAAAALAGTALVSCSEEADESASGSGNSNADPTDIIATTNVWADVASAVTGNEVEAIINDESLDPHHFEPTAKDLARIREAGTVVANGGHYDASLYTVAEQDRIIHAIPLEMGESHAGHDHGKEGHDHEGHNHGEEGHDHEGHDHGEEGHEGHDHGEITEIPTSIDELEHIWLSTDKVKEVAKAVQERAGGDAVDVEKRMDALHERLMAFPHVHLAMTEPIAAPLIWGTQLHDLTPEPYLLATLNENEPSVSDIAQTLELIDSGVLDFLIVNPQSTNNATERLVKAAEDIDLPIVEIRETPPEGVDFLDYFEHVVDEIAEVVEKTNPRPEAEIERFRQ